MCSMNRQKKWDEQTAAEIALESWNGITKHHILRAWDFDGDIQDYYSEDDSSDFEFIPKTREMD